MLKVVYFGSGDIGVPTLTALLKDPRREVLGVVTQPDRPVGRHQELRPTAVKTLALATGLPVFQPERLRRDEGTLAALRALVADVFVVFAYGQILPKSVLEMPRLACLNLHASLLPRWRGAAPIQAAIAAGDSETGMTVMWMDEGLDTGDVLLPGPRVPITPATTGGALHDQLAALAPETLLQGLDLLAAGRAPRTPQDPALATLAPKLDRESGRLHWQRPAAEIARLVQAMSPWPAAYTLLPPAEPGAAPRRVKVYSAALAPGASGPGAPGEVRRADEALAVAAGDGRLVLLEELQLEGKKRLRAAEFLRGQPLAPGTVLG